MRFIENLKQSLQQKRDTSKQPSLSGPRKKRKIAIIGAGSAGILTLVHFCTWLPDDWEVYSIHNPEKKILGIGESTNGGFLNLLQLGTHFTLGHPDDMAALDATLKFGSKFSNWREHWWINPLLDGNTAIHFNNFYLKDFVYSRLKKLWPKQFRVIEGDVKGMVNYSDRVSITINNQEHDFDFVVDCMGFPDSFDNYTLSDCSPVNRCQIASVSDYTFEPFTDHIAHKNGWMFGVPLQSRKTYGYLYNDGLTSREEALADMRQLLNIETIDDREYRFHSYYANKLIEGRICKNGNKALFFEPLVANSIFLYIYAARLFFDYINEGACIDKMNASFQKEVQALENTISYYYQGGSVYNSTFWDFATGHTRHRLAGRSDFTEIMALYRGLKERGVLNVGPHYGYKPLTWEIVDKQMGYGYIDGQTAAMLIPA